MQLTHHAQITIASSKNENEFVRAKLDVTDDGFLRVNVFTDEFDNPHKLQADYPVAQLVERFMEMEPSMQDTKSMSLRLAYAKSKLADEYAMRIYPTADAAAFKQSFPFRTLFTGVTA